MKIFWLFLSGIISINVQAEPTGLINKLMKTELSIFSYGLDKLDSYVEKQGDSGWFKGAHYDWDKNEIIITYTSFDKSICNTENSCFEKLKKFDSSYYKWLCISTDDNGSCDIVDVVANQFNPRGFVIKNFYNGKNSEDAAKDIKNIVVIKGKILKDKGYYVCTRKDTSSKMLCGIE